MRRGSLEEDVGALLSILREKDAGEIVCGLPLNADGTESVQTAKTMRFVEALRARTALPVHLQDERYTTMQARQVQIAGGVRRKDKKKSIDSIAASYILENYLAEKKYGGHV